ncbi:UBA/THIF-type NAD/FAD binding fold [Kalmanozyma brasiliensis GHG001]|uniref:Ubiquitin-activating enzyme E1-like n=1 Tax=Kalmanozyma brasiliensis (strain GHG001) TaxID=1365824 RepID=V5ETJ7_KALBG|nr:UBA/THIF-type NAD/FAD binding fold [Kalmanozyma brasiliensis GHG001]EST06388.1 UBA/THIF-type NAD/FAD binding fold [Kalmanozyma brasiliensis GHG001]
MSAVASSSKQNGEAAQPARYALAEAILGKEAFSRTNTAKILVVGAGGIGCELLKNLVLTGFGNIEIIDLDTIDLSNLNRQFLFQKQHIKKPKSLVAKQTASSFNPLVNIFAHHANIKEPRFGVAYFKGFDLVMNALDNLDARRWVNKMCVAANIPLIESGTTGFAGQVQPIRPGMTECYDCVPKATPKTFPVCTIRSTPSTPIHCIVWAKSWLFTQLFGADDETEDEELNKAVADGEDAQEIDSLRKEAREMRDMRAALFAAAKNGDSDKVRSVVERIFNKVYKNDIERLLGMEEMWTHRPVKPVPLVFADAVQGVSSVGSNGAAPAPPAVDSTATTSAAAPTTSNGSTDASTLKDQRTLTLQDNVQLFLSSASSLAVRAASDPTNPLSFDKDDDEALDFVTSTSNLRSIVYHIDRKTRFEVKQMAGNIIPAIASTNAIISGMLVLQALHILSGEWEKTRTVTLARGSDRYIASFAPGEPSSKCGTCQDVYVPVTVCGLERVTLGEVVEKVRGAMGMEDEEVVVYDGSRILADPDFEDNLEKSLKDVGLQVGSMLTITDEDQRLQAVNVVLSVDREAAVRILGEVAKPKPRAVDEPPTRDDSDDDIVAEVDPASLPAKEVKKTQAAKEQVTGIAGKKRPHPDDEPTSSEANGVIVEASTPEKKQRTLNDGSNAQAAIELD